MTASSNRNCGLPQELCEDILDSLWDDQEALLACSLACRVWIPTTRAHLFRFVRLHDERDCIRLQELLRLSASAATNVAGYFSELSIKFGGKSHDARSVEERMAHWIPQLLPTLQSITSLEISCADWGYDFLTEDARTCLMTFSSIITTLRLSYVTFPTTDDLTGLIHAYPRLSKLQLVHCRADPPVFEPLTLARLPSDHGMTTTQITELRASSFADMLVGLLSSPSRVSLRRLHWETPVLNAGDTLVRQILLEDCESSLEYLKLYFFHPQELIDLDLSKYPQLTTLHLCPHRMFSARKSVLCSPIPDFLSRITSVRMREIVLSVQGTFGSDTGYLEFLDWGKLDCVLASLRRRLPALVVSIQLEFSLERTADDPFSRVVGQVTERLPVALSAGLPVQVTYRDGRRSHDSANAPAYTRVAWLAFDSFPSGKHLLSA
ncbi:hypothetical protein WOLCODRAFT_145199 [Wolfiporia cocos MD-104 SS10]|uniref:F-box domain-containing protein n=1 Tax=Wolfiporia cocos (strain MD-104) TaxID=742152 RepID=A0A2H3K0Y2_WOLCO|nr:hypothetical protein WOLCODRAFT_145199 [Wolfiporia cocos MD-104 SS10]